MSLQERNALFNRMKERGVYDITSIGQHPGAVFFVNSVHGNASDAAGFGKSPDSPCATIDYAVSLCTASAGDVIYAMPGHVEDVDGAGALDLDVIGIHVIGLGSGGIQATLSMSAALATIDIGAASVTLEGFHISMAEEDVAVVIDVQADDFTLRKCRFSQSAVDLCGTVCVQDAAAGASDRITVEDCHAIMYDAANTHFINFSGTGAGHVVRNNVLIGDWGTMAIGGAGVVTLVSITDNYIYNAATTNDSGINLADTATGYIARNLIGIISGDNSTDGVNAIACSALENYVTDGGDVQGILDPAAT